MGEILKVVHNHNHQEAVIPRLYYMDQLVSPDVQTDFFKNEAIVVYTDETLDSPFN